MSQMQNRDDNVDYHIERKPKSKSSNIPFWQIVLNMALVIIILISFVIIIRLSSSVEALQQQNTELRVTIEALERKLASTPTP